MAAYPDREALVEFATGRRWTWAELDRDVDALALGLIGAGIAKGDRVGIWAPNCAEWTITQYATAKIGAILVNVNPAYRTHELAYVLNQSGHAAAGLGRRQFKTSDYRAMVERDARPDAPPWSGWSTSTPTTGPHRSPTAGAVADDAWPSGCATPRPDDPINIQYTSGTTGYPKGATLSHRNILNNGYFTTELISFTERGPALHPGALLPLLRHGHGQPRLHLPRRHDGHPGARLRPRRSRCARSQRSAARASTACRRCSSPMQNHPDVRRPRPLPAAHRDHGRLTCPVEVMKRCVNDMHMRRGPIATA